jgi:anthranilate synthase component 1
VRSLKRDIVDGEIIQAVPSQRISRALRPAAEGGPSALDIYRQLRVVNPSPYMFYLELGAEFQIVGASPEMLVKVDAARRVYTHPIAGTRRRGATPEEDEALARELLADQKERAEHVMLVDLGRNDVGRVAAPGSVSVDSLMQVEKYSHVMHIVSNVSGRLAPGRSAFDAFRAVFPAGTVSGAPKVRAVELVAALERDRRGVYAGAVGYVGFTGEMDTAIAIRTLVVRGSAVHLQAGAGIVFDSDPASEYDETIVKLGATMRAVDAAVEAAERRAAAAAAAAAAAGAAAGEKGR